MNVVKATNKGYAFIFFPFCEISWSMPIGLTFLSLSLSIQPYLCRLRRQHTEPDYDGGTTSLQLKPYFDAPLDSLLAHSNAS